MFCARLIILASVFAVLQTQIYGLEEVCEEAVMLQLQIPGQRQGHVRQSGVPEAIASFNATKVQTKFGKGRQEATLDNVSHERKDVVQQVRLDNMSLERKEMERQDTKDVEQKRDVLASRSWKTSGGATSAHGFFQAHIEPAAALRIAAGLLALVFLGEALPTRLSFLRGRFVVSFLAAVSSVSANFLAEACLGELRLGVMDLIYARCAALAFAGLVLMRIHPHRPAVFPGWSKHSVLLISAASGASACAMLCLAGLLFAPASLLMLALAVQTSFCTALKRVILGESIYHEEALCSLGMLLAAMPLFGCAVQAGARADATEQAVTLFGLSPDLSWLAGTIFGIGAALAAAGSALSQRQLCGHVHHTTLMMWTGVIGLVIFGPVAFVFPEQAKVFEISLTAHAPQIPILLAFAALSAISALSLCKAANASCGFEAEAGHLLVVGSTCCLQYAFDAARFGLDRYGPLGQSTLALLMTFTMLGYLVRRRELQHAAECIRRAWVLQLEPQQFH
eukprot:TRINITY_DN81106_c0_g1_i1.p1 TRINITY_DN81106_c0_g1~~TRINITY_DN81106_c0_g1_i1.p1  ORF type:complete len:509 (-),score=93.12 TRINITY_DN81106_c0_g1_i1:38-1564(-)